MHSQEEASPPGTHSHCLGNASGARALAASEAADCIPPPLAAQVEATGSMLVSLPSSSHSAFLYIKNNGAVHPLGLGRRALGSVGGGRIELRRTLTLTPTLTLTLPHP